MVAWSVHFHRSRRGPLRVDVHLVGSEPVSVMESTGQFAELVARGFGVVLLQPRGVKWDGTIDKQVFQRYETRQRRVRDQVAVMDAYLAGSGGIPVLLVGSSQGGVVAADIAATDSRVTHLIMMASVGGWTQAEEMELLVKKDPGTMGMASVAKLNAKLAEIRAAPIYRWFRPLDGLAKISMPTRPCTWRAPSRLIARKSRATRILRAARQYVQTTSQPNVETNGRKTESYNQIGARNHPKGPGSCRSERNLDQSSPVPVPGVPDPRGVSVPGCPSAGSRAAGRRFRSWRPDPLLQGRLA